MNTPMRLATGFVAGFLSVLAFHQGMAGLLHVLNPPGLGGPARYSMRPVPPLGVPAVIDAAFWGGLYGILYAALRPRLGLPGWLCGLLLGLLAVAVLVLVVAPLKHFHPLAAWGAATWVRILLIHLSWGLGVALLFALLTGIRPLRTA
ncbi:MAG: hypothetical protein J0H91_00935 [Rhodospirillales bacterium]|nr:hypothetical protein [Rhodospirillales bacterium]